MLCVSCYLACLLLANQSKVFALNGSTCWGKALNVPCHLACLMSAYQMGAFELNDSTCLGKGLNVSCYPACLVFACPLGEFGLNDSACWGKCWQEGIIYYKYLQFLSRQQTSKVSWDFQHFAQTSGAFDRRRKEQNRKNAKWTWKKERNKQDHNILTKNNE